VYFTSINWAKNCLILPRKDFSKITSRHLCADIASLFSGSSVSVSDFTRNGGGHVAFYISKTSSGIKVLGGNQSDAVNISTYPASKLLGYRIPG
jgi:hypothetical protein